MTGMLLSRRSFLTLAGSFAAWAHVPRFARASGRDPRLVVIILRGAIDGLAVIPPIGDPNYLPARGRFAIGSSGASAALPLDGFFAMNPAMPTLHSLFKEEHLAVVHAVATPYRDRSHFDGQDILESGVTKPGYHTDGWLNRAASVLPVGERIAPRGGLAVSPTVPLILRGKSDVMTWTPTSFKPADSDTVQRLLDLYKHRDPALAKVYQSGVGLDEMAMQSGGSAANNAKKALVFKQLAEGAARLLVRDDGPRVAALSYDGWDTHASEGSEHGQLFNLLSSLDLAIEALRKGMQPVWNDTVALVVTEFGRTVKFNGTNGTDHGTGTIALAFGGAVKGGIRADWPGLAQSHLYEGRDLAPTTDLRAFLKGILKDHLGLSDDSLASTVFPDSGGVRPLSGLIAA